MFRWLFSKQEPEPEPEHDEWSVDTTAAIQLLRSGEPDRSDETAEQLDTPDGIDIDLSAYRYGKK